MSESEQYELIGRTRANYREAKKELAASQMKAGELAKIAATIKAGLERPELIRWWEGVPMMGRPPGPGPGPVVFTSAMFGQLTEKNVKELLDDLKKIEASISAMRTQLIQLEGEDPDR